jgi:hypothetical protein
MKYLSQREDILTALNLVRGDRILIPRWKIEEEIGKNPGKYPSLNGMSQQTIRLAISQILINQPGVSMISRNKPVFMVSLPC